MAKVKKQVEVIEAIPTISLRGNEIKPIKRVAAYCRVSSDHIEQKTSYDAQIDEYTTRIKNNPKWELVGIYADEARTGTNTFKRTNFNRLILDAKQGKIDYIITKSISRFARNVQDSINIVKLLKDIDVEVFFEKENLSSFDVKSDMVFAILASVAQEESRNISENCTWSIHKMMKDGRAIVNHKRFLGYDKNDDGELIVNEEQAKVVRFIFNRYLEGAGYTTIAKECEEKGFITGAGNTKWHSSTVSGILQNEKYYGELLLQKTLTVDYLTHKRVDNKGQKDMFRIEENHQAIISKEVWLAVKAKREQKFVASSGNDTNREKYSAKYAFSGKLICANCGSTLKRRTWNAKTPVERIVWQCNDYINKGVNSCSTKAIGDLTIKRAFVSWYNSILKDKSTFFETFIKTIERVIKKSNDKNKYQQVHNEIKKLEDKISKLVQMKIDREISQNDFKREYTLLSEIRDKHIERKNNYIEKEIDNDEKLRQISLVREIINTNNNPLTDFDDDIFKAIIDKVIVRTPVSFSFVLINGMEFAIDGRKYNDGRKYKTREF